MPIFDIVATDGEHRTILVQVKATRRGNWQFNASKFLDIKQEGETQRVLGKKPILNPGLICVFVRVGEYGKDRFFILYLEELQDIICEKYTSFIKRSGGRRPYKPESTHVAIRPRQLEEKGFEGRWDLLGTLVS